MKTKVLNIKKGDVIVHKISKNLLWVAVFEGFTFKDVRTIDFENNKVINLQKRVSNDGEGLEEKKSYSVNILNKKEVEDLLKREEKIKVAEAL